MITEYGKSFLSGGRRREKRSVMEIGAGVED
jgi:hypothetical protein